MRRCFFRQNLVPVACFEVFWLVDWMTELKVSDVSYAVCAAVAKMRQNRFAATEQALHQLYHQSRHLVLADLRSAANVDGLKRLQV